MDYPDNSENSPPSNPSSKKKRKTSNAAARRAAAARFANGPDSLLPPAPRGGPNATLVANNPFDDSPVSMSGPPGGYPGGMDFMMMRGQAPPAMQQPLPPMNMNYGPMTSNANASMSMMLQNFGHSVGPMFNELMMARVPGPLRHRLPRREPSPYFNAPVPGAISTLSRMHMSMGAVNVANPPAPAVSIVNNMNLNLNLAGMPATSMMPSLTSNDNKRKAPQFYADQAPMQPYEHFQFDVAAQHRYRQPMYEMPSNMLHRLPYNQSQPPVPGNSILQSQLTRPINPCTTQMFMSDDQHPPLTLEQQVPDAVPTPCGGCELAVYPGEVAIMCRGGCEFWFHRECSGLTVMAHHLIMITPLTEWVCQYCINNKDIQPIKFTK